MIIIGGRFWCFTVGVSPISMLVSGSLHSQLGDHSDRKWWQVGWGRLWFLRLPDATFQRSGFGAQIAVLLGLRLCQQSVECEWRDRSFGSPFFMLALKWLADFREKNSPKPPSTYRMLDKLMEACNGLWFNNLGEFEISADCQQERIHPIVASDVPCEKLRELFPLWTKMPSAIRGSAIFADSQGNSQKGWTPKNWPFGFLFQIPNCNFCLGDFVDLLIFMKIPPFFPPVKLVLS